MASCSRRFLSSLLTYTRQRGQLRTCSWSQHKAQHLSLRCMSTESPAAGPQESDIKLSDSCVRRLKQLGETRSYLRVVVDGGGCSGFEYKFSIDKEINDEDKVFEKDGVGVIIDTESLEFLKGSTIDYHEELIRSSFRVVDNPQAEQGCSCGASFSLKL